MSAHDDIRIGTLVPAHDRNTEVIRQLLPHGFETLQISVGKRVGDVRSSCSSNTDRTVLNHGKRSGEFCLVLSDGTGDDTALFLIGNAIDANEHNAAVVKSLPIDEFTKILVFGDQDPCVLHGCFKNDVVASSLKLLSHPPDIMAVATDGTNDRFVHALVGEESHADSRSPTE